MGSVRPHHSIKSLMLFNVGTTASPTSLRSLRELRLGKPARLSQKRSERRLPRRSPKGEDGPAQLSPERRLPRHSLKGERSPSTPPRLSPPDNFRRKCADRAARANIVARNDGLAVIFLEVAQ